MSNFAKHALVIGIDAYGNGVPPLRSAVSDATAVAEVLRQDQHYDSVHLLTDGEATREGILHALEHDLRQRVHGSEDGEIEEGGPDDGDDDKDLEVAVILYFAGHGFARGDGDAHEEYLLPQEADGKDRGGWLPMSEVHRALGRLRCRHLLVILDCCFAGAFRRAASRSLLPVDLPFYQSAYDRYLDGKAWQILASASEDELAQDRSFGAGRRGQSAGDGNHSPFASALLRGLSGKADSERGDHGQDGVITSTELFQFIDAELRQHEGGRQTPGLFPFDPTDLRSDREFVFTNPAFETPNIQPNPELDESNNPWRGLEAYGEANAGLFFGRERAIEGILALLDPDGPRWITLVGASGTGKSSLARAGLLPLLGPEAEPPDARIRADPDALRSLRTWVAPRIERHSLHWPETALRQVEKTLLEATPLVFIDQFEELFTRLRRESERRRYIRGLEQLVAAGARLLITLRSDFEPQLMRFASIMEIYPRGRFLVPSFERDELREIIERPAIAKALYFEPEALVDELVNEVYGNANALPMLSFTLAEVYRRALLRRRATGTNDRALKRSDYDELGGVTGSVRRCVLEIYEEQDEAHRETLRRLFLRLVTRDGNRLARRRVQERELVFGPRGSGPRQGWLGQGWLGRADTREAWHEQQRVEAVLEKFREARLVSIEGGYVEPAHDSLVTGWEQTEAWLSEFGYLQLLRQLWERASEWDEVRTPRPRDTERSRLDPRRWASFGWRHWRAIRRLWLIEPSIPLLVSKEMRRELNWLETRFVRASWRWFRIGFWAAGTAVVVLLLSLASLLTVATKEGHRADLRSLEAENHRRLAEQARRRAADRARLLVARDLRSENPLQGALVLLGSENLGQNPRDDQEIFDFLHHLWRSGSLGPTYPPEPVAALDWNGAPRLWHPPWTFVEPRCRAPEHFAPVARIGLAEDGLLLLETMDGETLRWRTEDGWRRLESGARPAATFAEPGPWDRLGGDRSILGADGRVVVSRRATGTGIGHEGRPIELPGRYRWALVDREKEHVVTLDIDRRLRLWPLGAQALVRTLAPAVEDCLSPSILVDELGQAPEEARRADRQCRDRPVRHTLRFTLGEESWKERN